MLFVLFLPFYRLQHDLSERKRVFVDGQRYKVIMLSLGIEQAVYKSWSPIWKRVAIVVVS